VFESKTFEVILEDILSRIPDSFDKREGSIIYDAVAPAAVEIQNLYLSFDLMMNECFGDTASREYLVRHAKQRDMIPYPATHSVLQAEFTPNTLEIPIGSRFNSQVSSYVVTEKISDGIYKLNCEEAGTIGNQYVGKIIPVEFIMGLQTATITKILIYGENEEATEDLRTRFMDSFKMLSFGGNRAEYKEKALSIAGVGAMKVEPAWNGPGTVRVTVIDSEFGKGTSELVTKVQTEFDPNADGRGDGLAPIGHTVTVRTVNDVAINVSATITYDTNYSWSTHGTLIQNAIEAYLLSLRKQWANNDNLIVRIAQIETAIMNVNGIVDIQNTKINGSASNLTLAFEQIPVMGSVTA